MALIRTSGGSSSGVTDSGTYTAAKTLTLNGSFKHIDIQLNCAGAVTVDGNTVSLSTLGQAHTVFGLFNGSVDGTFTNPVITMGVVSNVTSMGYVINAY